MILDIEITLNRFGFYKPAPNKIQVGPVRLSLWRNMKKWAVSFEVNWLRREQRVV